MNKRTVANWMFVLAIASVFTGFFFLMFAWILFNEQNEHLERFDVCASVADSNEEWLSCTKEWREE